VISAALLALVVAAVAITAVATPNSGSDGRPVSAARLKAELLPLSSLPAGWTSTPAQPSGGNTGGSAAGACNVGSGHQPDQTGRVSTTYLMGRSIELDEVITGFDTSGAGTYSTYINGLSRCHSFSSGGATFSVGQMSLPTVGTKSMAFQAATEVSGTSVAIDMVVALKGDQVLLIGYTSLGTPDATKLEVLARRAAARLP
jgi:hypothetical protein